MRRSLSLPVTLLLAGCGSSQQMERPQEDLKSYSVEEPAPPSIRPQGLVAPRAEFEASPRRGPDVAPTAAPGVAFNYRYAFRLPPLRIAEVQEQHAAACEQLGVARCRITGMSFRHVSEHHVEAMLALKVEPSLARRFGRAGARLVSESEGMLAESEIGGTDAEATIRDHMRRIAEMREALARIESRLARGGISADERLRMENEADRLRQAIRAGQASREAEQDSLANTPILFSYASTAIAAVESGPSLQQSLERSGNNFVQGVTIILIIIVTLAPWLLLALAGWWLIRPAVRRFRPFSVEPDAAFAPA